MTNRLDHLIYTGPDLDGAIAHFETLTGITPGKGGVHPGLGTRNALLSLGDDHYFELLCPDPEQELEGTHGGMFIKLPAPTIWAYMLKGQDFDKILATLGKAGIEADVIDASRTTPAGETLTWRLLLPKESPFGDFVPKFIDWMDSPHPSASATKGCSLISFEIGHPKSNELGALLEDLESDIPVFPADRPLFLARLATPNGEVIFTGP